ncbi:MAG: peptide MFS transporter [Acidobacteriota bacterium]|nr:peptide MFS transporter [Acidobacteriota bacterium]
MSDASATQKTWFGHPSGLATLFFTEMWERFSFYGMRAILTLFMTAPVSIGGLGWPADKAGPIYGLYAAMVYVTALPGGWIADKFIGQRNAVLLGGIVIAAGHVSLMFHGLGAFYFGLFLIVVGTGFLKPNISALVGGLYEQNDARRDAGFSIFYMGINVGAFASPLVCGWLAQHASFQNLIAGWGMDPTSSWHWGFGAAAVGMGLGVIQYVLGDTRGGVFFRWLAVGLLCGFLLLMLFVSGTSDVTVEGELAQFSGPLMLFGALVAGAVVLLHVCWLLAHVLANKAIRQSLKWGALGSLVTLILVTISVYSGYTITESGSGELAPRHDILFAGLILSVLLVLGHAAWVFLRGQKIYSIVGVAVAAGLFLAKLDRIEDATVALLVVRLVGYALPVFSYIYFARLFTRPDWNETERKRIYAIPVFFLGAAVFWSAFEQAGTSLNLFADRFTLNVFLGFPYPSSWFQSVNALLIVLLAPAFAWGWVKLAKAGREPASPMKFAVGLYLLGVGFAVLSFGAIVSGPDGARVGPMWLLSVYLLHTLGELCLSPVGLSTMTKLAPKRISGQMMGVWFLGAAIGNFIGGIVAGFFESLPLPLLFGAIFGTTMLATIVMLLIVKPVRRLMSGIN